MSLVGDSLKALFKKLYPLDLSLYGFKGDGNPDDYYVLYERS